MISFVIPCYNEEKELKQFYTKLLTEINKTNEDYEIIFVDDGSFDNTNSILKEFAIDKKVKIVTLSRNFGQQSAVLCGFNHAKGDCVIEIDVKLDLPINLIHSMIEKWKEGYLVVHTQNKLKRNGFTRFFEKIYLKLLHKLSKIDLPLDTDEYKLYDKKVVKAICSLNEQDLSIITITSWLGFKQTTITYSQKMQSKSKKNIISKAMKFASDGILNNCTFPLKINFILGTVLSILSNICMTVFTTLAICKIYLPVAAWIFPTLLILFSFLFMANSFTNSYLAKIYNEVKSRPSYIETNTLNID